MSAIVLAVSYNFATKKISCPKSHTLGQVIQLALEKFKIDGDEYSGELVHNGKTLDGSLPLRFTGLSNNSKVELRIKKGTASHDITVKLTASPPNASGPQNMIGKFDAKSTLQSILDHFEREKNVKLTGFADHILSMNIMNTSIAEGEFVSTTLVSVVGSPAPNTVIRLNYTTRDNSEQVKAQQQIIELQMKRQQEREHKKRLEIQESAAALEEENRIRRVQAEHIPDDRNTENPISSETPTGVVSANSQHDNKQNSEFPQTKVPDQTTNAQSYRENNHTVPKENSSVPELQSEHRQDPPKKPQLYVPDAQSTSIYENPDSDYELTVSHAQVYQRLVRESARPQKSIPPTSKTLPSAYHIKVKFPDRSILQLDLPEAATTTLAGLVERIDGYLLPQHKNQYVLKMAYPPFAAISLTAKSGPALLHSLPDFQSSAVLIIWEPLHAKTPGPFVQSSLISTVSARDMPEVQLETQRASIRDEATSENSTLRGSDDTDIDTHESRASARSSFGLQAQGVNKPSGSKKVPKWFRMK